VKGIDVLLGGEVSEGAVGSNPIVIFSPCAALPYLLKAEGPEDSDDLTRTQDRDLAHG
jgi:hypothetical protein